MKLQIIKKKIRKFTNTEIKQPLLINQWVDKEPKRKPESILRQRQDYTYKYLGDATKAVLRAKFRAISAYIREKRNISKR